VPKHANKEHDHRKTKLSLPYDLEGYQKTGSLGSCVASIDIGSKERMIMQNFQISETAESRIVPNWLFPPRFSDKDRFTSSRPDFVLVTPIAAKTQNYCRGVGSSKWQGAIEGDWENPSSTASHQ